jgi:TetR/AcrR family transcriptional regulator, ethionamide resistance regulator
MSRRAAGATSFEASRRNDRPRAHHGNTDAEATIFDATERLLEKVPLHDISVADIISEAQISRATFYFYFSSKFAVVTGLLARVMEEIYDLVRPFVEREENETPEEALRRSLHAAVKVWADHRPALRATHEHWHAVPELRDRWLAVVEQFTDAVATQIDRERKAGTAPAGPDSRQLAAALLWSTDRCLYVAAIGGDDDLPSETDIVEPLICLWLGALYGGGHTASSTKTRSRRSPR